MSWFSLTRVPEKEVMAASEEVEAYASAAGQAYLDWLDDTFVLHALRLLRGRETGCGLDIGSGPGQIVMKLARRLPGWRFIGVDRSANMIRRGRAASSAGSRVSFFVADGGRLPFPDSCFDLVLCNSVLHHLAEPQRLFSEVARVVSTRGAVLLRDLRRPSRLAYPLHVGWYGRHYSGLMYKLYRDSVRAAYTRSELEAMLLASPLAARARMFQHGRTHLGLEQPAGN